MADDALLNQFISQGTAAERAAFTPTPPTPIAGPEVGYFWFETDTGDFYGWDTGGAAWVKIAEATSVNAITALTGDVTATGPGSVAATIANDAVTFAKMQNIATDSLIGRDTAGSGDPENILLNATLSMDGSGNLQRAALTGDVTAAAGSNATTIANDAVTLAKIANAAANDKLLGSGNAGAGANYEEITLGSGLTMTGTTLSASGSGGTIGGSTGATDEAILVADGAGGSTLQAATPITINTATGAITFPDDVRQTFNPGANAAGLNVGSIAGDPATPSNGDIWYDSTANELTARINGASVALGAGGGGTYAFGITIDGGGSDITTGVKGFVQLPTTGTIVRATILSTDAAATAGSIVIDVWKDTYANYPPTDADSITAAAPPTLSAANKNTDSTLTGWTTSVTALDIVGFNVDSCSGITRVTLIIEVTT